MMFKLEDLDHIALAVRDVEKSVQWYEEVLGLKKHYEEEWGGYPVFLLTGSSGVALFPAKSSKKNTARPGSKVKHFAFRANRDNFAKAQKELQARKIKFQFEDHGIAHSIYFHDPDGFLIEITTYQISKTQ